MAFAYRQAPLQGRLKGYSVQTARFIDLNGCFQYLF